MRLFLSLCLVMTLIISCGSRTPKPHEGADATAPAVVVPDITTYPRFGDADPHDWEGRKPTSYPVHGIDISRWQGAIDWRQAKKSGVSFAFIKATEGGDLLDPKFDLHRRGAEKAGVPWGAYHYFYFCRPAEEQARWFIRNVPKGADLPHVLDMEWTPNSRTCTRRPGKREVWQEARTFMNMLEAHYGRRPILYTTVDFWADTDIGQLARTEFWVRSVAGHPGKVYPRAYWSFWQYTGTGLVPGIEGQVDINVFRGSPESWAQWMAGQP